MAKSKTGAQGEFTEKIRRITRGVVVLIPASVGYKKGSREIISVPNKPGRVYVMRDGSTQPEIAWLPAQIATIGIQYGTRIQIYKRRDGDYQILDDDVALNSAAYGIAYTAIPATAIQKQPILVNQYNPQVQLENAIYLASYPTGVPYVAFGSGLDRTIRVSGIIAQRNITTTITNTTETVISVADQSGYTGSPDKLTGAHLRLYASGIVTGSTGVTFTLRVKWDSTTLVSFALPGTSGDTGWRLEVNATIRIVGSSGAIIANGVLDYSGGRVLSTVNNPTTVNTSLALTLTSQADTTPASLSCSQYLLEQT